MEDREQKIRRWFEMWLQQSEAGMEDIFDRDAVYIESWGPEYHGLEKIRHWFREWNSRGTVMRWDIRQFFHRGIKLWRSGPLRTEWMMEHPRLLRA